MKKDSMKRLWTSQCGEFWVEEKGAGWFKVRFGHVTFETNYPDCKEAILATQKAYKEEKIKLQRALR